MIGGGINPNSLFLIIDLPIESMTDQSEASYSEVIAIEDITAIQLIKEKPLILLLLPGILVLVLMKSFGLG